MAEHRGSRIKDLRCARAVYSGRHRRPSASLRRLGCYEERSCLCVRVVAEDYAQFQWQTRQEKSQYGCVHLAKRPARSRGRIKAHNPNANFWALFFFALCFAGSQSTARINIRVCSGIFPDQSRCCRGYIWYAPSLCSPMCSVYIARPFSLLLGVGWSCGLVVLSLPTTDGAAFLPAHAGCRRETRRDGATAI